MSGDPAVYKDTPSLFLRAKMEQVLPLCGFSLIKTRSAA